MLRTNLKDFAILAITSALALSAEARAGSVTLKSASGAEEAGHVVGRIGRWAGVQKVDEERAVTFKGQIVHFKMKDPSTGKKKAFKIRFDGADYPLAREFAIDANAPGGSHPTLIHSWNPSFLGFDGSIDAREILVEYPEKTKLHARDEKVSLPEYLMERQTGFKERFDFKGNLTYWADKIQGLMGKHPTDRSADRKEATRRVSGKADPGTHSPAGSGSSAGRGERK